MGFLQGNTTPAASHPIFAFWTWWSEGGMDELTHAVSTGDYGSLPDTIAALTGDIDPNLAWELSAGSSAPYRFSLTAGGIAELRPLAERWKRAAPATGGIWEFASSIVRSSDPLEGDIALDGRVISLELTRFAVTTDERRLRFNVVAYNPEFIYLSHETRLAATYLMLDWCLGEDDVERWIGMVDAATEVASDSLTARDLACRVDALAARRDDSEWVLVRRNVRDGIPTIASVRLWTRWIDHPLLDQHNIVTVPFADMTEQGLPSDAALCVLRAIETDLERRFGETGLLVAHETCAGARTLHFYTDSDDQNVSESLQQWVADLGDVGLDQAADPSWQRVRELTG